MSYNVKTTSGFDQEVKRIAKKHTGIKIALTKLISDLELNPTLGIELGQSLYKIRLAIPGTNKGKSGGARIITCVVFVKEIVYLSAIYLKNEHDTVDAGRIVQRLKDDRLI